MTGFGVTLACSILGFSALGYVAIEREFFTTSPLLKAFGPTTVEITAYPQAARDRKFDRMSAILLAPSADTLSPDDRLVTQHVDQVLALPPEDPVASPPLPRPRPKTLQRAYTLLSDIQIDAIKGRLKLTAEQESSWPAVEVSLRALAARLHEIKSSGGALTDLPPNSPEIVGLQIAATPFISQLRANQKQELKMLAYLVGLGKVVAQL